MFGLSKREKALKIVSDSVDACLDVYRDGVRTLIIKEMNGEISSEKFKELEQVLQGEFYKCVAQDAIEKISKAYPDSAAVANEYTRFTSGVHTLYSHLCKAMTGKEIASFEQYSMMTAVEKGLAKEEQEIRDSLAE